MTEAQAAPRVSIVMPVYNEGEHVVPVLEKILDEVAFPCEVLVVYDTPDDATVPYLVELGGRDGRVVPTLNTYGRGPARAIRFGMDTARAEVVVVTMADGSDDPSQIALLTRLVEDGAVVAAASRYMRGGRQIGGPPLKCFLSRSAGVSLHWFAGVGTHDATSSYKAYSRPFVRRVGVESDAGFEVALELVAKARRYRCQVAEIPTTWRDRTSGESNFKLWRWLPRYLRWYVHAFGPRLR
jgi:glycosyltransferase involved in cell wall biosynthesis